MQFTKDKNGFFQANIEIQGHPMTVLISEPSILPNDREITTRDCIRQFQALRTEIRDSIVTELHGLYNESWTDPKRGIHKVSVDEFLSLLSPAWLSVFGSDAFQVYFEDGGLFGGHMIDVYISDGVIQDVSLAG